MRKNISPDKIKYHLLLLLMGLLAGAPSLFAQAYHKISNGETLYSIVLRYKVSGQSICRENPGLTAVTFLPGAVIRIPDFTHQNDMANSPIPGLKKYQLIHVVKRKETLYSISQKYQLTIQDIINANPQLINGIRKGVKIEIPYKQGDLEAGPTNKQYFDSILVPNRKLQVIKAAIIFPLHSNNKYTAQRVKNYIRGMYLAADSLEQLHINVQLKCYDSGNTAASMQAVLKNEELKSMDILFGPYYKEQVPAITSFAKKQEIKVIIPSLNNKTNVENNPYVFQINTPAPYLYPSINNHLLQTFGVSNIIFLDAKSNYNENRTFILELNDELTANGSKIKTLKYTASIAQMKSIINPDIQNIFIPISSSSAPLAHWIPQLIKLNKEMPQAKITLFGYPIWQTYKKLFDKISTYFYSTFYSNPNTASYKHFANDYHKRYSTMLPYEIPNYAILGFDTSYFFFKALADIGNHFERETNDLKNKQPLQNRFNFKRLGMWGGFINKGLCFVHFETNQESIIDFDK